MCVYILRARALLPLKQGPLRSVIRLIRLTRLQPRKREDPQRKKRGTESARRPEIGTHKKV
jgi:hypothetical protein